MCIAVYKDRYHIMTTEAATTLTYQEQNTGLGLLRFPSSAVAVRDKTTLPQLSRGAQL